MTKSISIAQYKNFRPNKYRAIKSGGKDSIKEHKRTIYLREEQKDGRIRELQEQVTFMLQESFKDSEGNSERAIKYIADFVYFDNKKKCWIVEDVKSAMTKKLAAYIIKRKLFKKKYSQYIFKEF